MENKLKFSSVLQILMGIVTLNEFIRLWDKQFFTPLGYQHNLQALYNASFFSIPKHIIQCLMWGGGLFSSIAAITLIFTACCLITGIFSLYAVLTLTAIFMVYFIAHIGTLGTWVYEFTIPLGFAILLLIHHTTQHFSQHKSKKIFGDFHSVRFIYVVLAALLTAFVLYLINIASKNAYHYQMVGILTAASSFILLMVNFFISSKGSASTQPQQPAESYLLSKVVIFIGMMLVTQVNMNHLIKWFTPDGYVNLINTYQHYSTIGPHISSILNMIKQHVSIALSIQTTLESFLALCLVALVFRPFAFILSALLFISLAIIEFGVPGTFPVQHPIEYTWTWELFLTAMAMTIISCYEIKRIVHTKGLLKKLLGPIVYVDMSLFKRVKWCVIVGILAFCIVYFSHNVAKQLLSFSIQSGLTVFFYLLLFQLLDSLKNFTYKRTKKSYRAG